ncbi:hypothetical protein L596_009674 [Steinernema carpocapsae]|uniref:Uncharacterized protein n=1 Tax=Steinernema carpocapsae TaxID=34508 RepID=A0A4U5PHC2_STECR|nr:hypothetical protein L596_009674 [Steinernema carpocapsae]
MERMKKESAKAYGLLSVDISVVRYCPRYTNSSTRKFPRQESSVTSNGLRGNRTARGQEVPGRSVLPIWSFSDPPLPCSFSLPTLPGKPSFYFNCEAPQIDLLDLPSNGAVLDLDSVNDK